MNKPIVLVAGTPSVSQFLEKTPFFEKVYNISKMSELKQVVTSPDLRSVSRTLITFVCGDSIEEDDPSLTMSEFLRKITAAGYNTIVVSVTAKGAELQRQNPRAKLLQVPMTLNDLLYALSSFGYPITPVDEGGVTIPVHPIQFNAAVEGGQGALDSPQASSPATENSVVGDSKNPTRQEKKESSPSKSQWVNVEEVEEKPLTGPLWTPAATVTSAAPKTAEPPVPQTDRIPGQAAWDDSEIFDKDTEDVTKYDSSSNWIAAPPPPPAPTAPPTQNYEAVSSQNSYNPPNNFDNNSPSPMGVKKTLSGVATSAPPENPWYGSNGSALGPQSRQGYDVAQYNSSRRGFVITVSTSKGGTGKSSLSLNLAAFLGMRLRSQGKTVCIIDANTQQADTGKYLDIYRPNINTIVNDPSLLTEESIMNALVHKPEYNLSALLGPATPDEANPLAISARLYSQVLDLLRKHFDYIIIDTAVAEKFHEMFSQFALPKADYIIVPVAPNFTTLHNADNWLRSAVAAPKHEGGAGIDPSRVGVVLNRAEEGIGCSEADVRATLASWHFIGSVPETKEWKAANNRNELIAPKNYAELSHAFAEVLHAATREPILTENFSLIEAPKKGLGSKFKKMLGKG